MAKRAKKRGRRLTLKQQLFCEAYVGVAHGNATEAARLAGYSGSREVHAAIGAENLGKPTIAVEIERLTRQPRKALRDEDIRELWWSIATDPDAPFGARLRALADAARASGLFAPQRKRALESLEDPPPAEDDSEDRDLPEDSYDRWIRSLPPDRLAQLAALVESSESAGDG